MAKPSSIIDEGIESTSKVTTSGPIPDANPRIVSPDMIDPIKELSPVIQTQSSQSQVPNESTVTVKKDELSAILERLKILEQTASQNDLEEARSKNRPAELPSAYLKVFMDKIVIGWKSERPEMVYNPMNPNSIVGEILKSKYFFFDGSDSGTKDQVLFTRAEDRVMVRILSDDGLKVKIRFEKLITSNEDLKVSFKLPTEVLEIRKDFLNP